MSRSSRPCCSLVDRAIYRRTNRAIFMFVLLQRLSGPSRGNKPLFLSLGPPGASCRLPKRQSKMEMSAS